MKFKSGGVRDIEILGSNYYTALALHELYKMIKLTQKSCQNFL